MRIWTKRTLGQLAMTLCPLAAQAQVDLTVLDRDMAGPRAQVLVLGTMHLREMPASFDPAALKGVLDRLAAFRPEIITIENEPGEECDMAARYPSRYGSDYCPSTEAARAATGLDMPAAIVEVSKVLKTWPAQPTPAQRRRLAATMLAANDRVSAYVQWLYLPAAERRAGDSLSPALVELLGKAGTRKDEAYQMAAPLAARLGLQRVHAVDNHTGDRIDVPDIKAFLRPLEAAWATDTVLKAQQQQQEPLMRASDLLPLYRALNAPGSMQAHAEANIVPTMRARSPEGYPQIWVAGWEIRNLRMVANIRETFRERPGARVLTIVGSSHKPWFDSWLGQLQGVDIVDVAQVLK